jgi:signal transduction histidine kinase
VSAQPGEAGAKTVCGISLDVTQQKQLELELVHAQKLEAIGQLSAGIAHEINTPTQFVGDNIRFLQSSYSDMRSVLEEIATAAKSSKNGFIPTGPITSAFERADIPYILEEAPKAISQSLEGVGRIAKIVGAMREFSHPGTDRTLLDINRAIAGTITVATNEWKFVADVKTDFDRELPTVPVIPGAFNQVILNMLVNAAHAIAGAAGASSTRAKGEISISTRRRGEWAEIAIGDTGCGMPPEVVRRIFEPFFTTKPVGQGTGQGLAIAHDVIVKKHGGTVTVDSSPGAGTTFTLRFPLASESEPAASPA